MTLCPINLSISLEEIMTPAEVSFLREGFPTTEAILKIDGLTIHKDNTPMIGMATLSQ
jgi:hypothetical protein